MYIYNMLKTKKLLIVIPSLHVGGTENHLCQVLPGLKDCGWDITIYLTSGTGELTNQLEAAGIKIRRPGYLSRKLHNRHKLLRAPLLLITFLQLSIYLIRNKPDASLFMLPEAYLLGGLSGVLTGQKNMLMGRRSLNNYQQKYFLLSKLETWLHTKMRFIITNSQANINQLSQQEHVPASKLKLIYNGIEIKNINAEKNNFLSVLPNSSLRLVIVANILPYKGHAVLLQALAEIKNKLPADWQLVCVGKKYDYAQELENLAEQLNINNNIHWLGSQNHSTVQEILSASNIAISSSYEEGFSNAVLEAMAAGLPLIVTDVGGNPEAVVHGVNGLVVPSKDANSLGAAILELVNNPEQIRNMGAESKKRAKEVFSLAACIEEYSKVLEHLPVRHNIPSFNIC